MTRPPLYLPTTTGPAAMAELDRVPWGTLRHAYGVGPVGPELEGDVRASLAALARQDPDALHALWSNTCHQGTIYEATAYAVPFLAAFLAGENVDPEIGTQVAVLLADVAVASCFETEDGSHAGSFGPNVAPRTREALAACVPWLEKSAARYEPVTALLGRTVELMTADAPTNEQIVAVEDAIAGLDPDE